MKRTTSTLMMIMKRSMHACKLTAGKFASVDLPTFLAVRILLAMAISHLYYLNLSPLCL